MSSTDWLPVLQNCRVPIGRSRGSPLLKSSWASVLRRMLDRVMGLVSVKSCGAETLGRRIARPSSSPGGSLLT